MRLNTIFYFILVADLLLYLSLFKGANKYLDGSSIVYYIIFSLCILSTIIINGKRKNVFIELLIILILISYHSRIPMLLLLDMPTIMNRISISSDLVNSKIMELCYHYLALSIAIIVLNPKINKLSHYITKHRADKIMWFASIVILFDIVSGEFLSDGYGGTSSFMGHFRIILSVFPSAIAVLIIITYIVAAGKTLARSHKYWAVSLISTYVIYRSYSGSKQPIAFLILAFIIAKMICYGPIIIKSKHLIMSILLIPLVGLNFFFANIMRFYQRGIIGTDSVINELSMIKSAFRDILYSVSYRMGYFDYYVESSENSLYPPYISFKYYFMSITDKLTPGFDVFGVVYASRMFRYARDGAMPATMHSDQVTLFGEASVIFRFFSIIMFFVMILFFSFLIKRRPEKDPFLNILYSAIIFRAYWGWLYGFGFDMFFCVDLVYNIVFFFCMAWFCRIRLHKRKKLLIKQLC